MWSWLPPWRRLVGFAPLAALVVVCGAVLVAWSGIINIAASRGHWAITAWFLDLAMVSSVRTYSLGLAEPPPLDDGDLVRLGAGHYAGGCAPCHGSPAELRNPIYLQMLPEPTELSKAVLDWSPRELFWIVKHGIKYSGMPAWVGTGRDDEIWAVVAFLRTLPNSDAEQYRGLAAGNVNNQEGTASEILRNGMSRTALVACARCHGDESAPPTSRLVPSLAGHDHRYIERSLREYAQGHRSSGIMQPIAAELDDEATARLAIYYSNLPPRGARRPPPSPELIELGRRIVHSGVPQQSLPACAECHDGRASAAFPRLGGQSARYIAGQLRLWQRGGRSTTTYGRIMATIAPRLTEQQIEAVAAFFESVDPAAGGSVGASSHQEGGGR